MTERDPGDVAPPPESGPELDPATADDDELEEAEPAVDDQAPPDWTPPDE